MLDVACVVAVQCLTQGSNLEVWLFAVPLVSVVVLLPRFRRSLSKVSSVLSL